MIKLVNISAGLPVSKASDVSPTSQVNTHYVSSGLPAVYVEKTTIRSSGGDYSSLTGWESGEQADLVSANKIVMGVIYNDWPSGLTDNRLDFYTGWTTDNARYPKLTVADGHWHQGKPGTGFKWICNDNRTLLIRNGGKAVIDRFEVDSSNNTDISFYATNDIGHINNCLFDQLYNQISVGISNFIFKNCAFYNLQNADRFIDGTTSVVFYNCSFDLTNCTGQTILLRDGSYYNCAAYATYSPSLGCWYTSCLGDYNAGVDTSAPGANSIDSLSLSDFNWVDPSNGDFTLVDDTGSLDGAGYRYPAMVGTDITNSDWSSPPSIGVAELGEAVVVIPITRDVFGIFRSPIFSSLLYSR